MSRPVGTSSSGLPEICVVGSSNLDIVVRVPRHPVPGETVLGGDHRRISGGKGANQAVAAARLGSQVSLIGRVGPDPAGVELRDAITSAGVDTSHLLTSESHNSGIALISVGPDGENSIVVSPGANLALGEADIESAIDHLESAAVTLLQLETPIETVTMAAEVSSGLVLLNPAPAQPVASRLYEAVDLLVPNETELAHLAGAPRPRTIDEAVQMARSLPFDGPVVVTLGGDGALVVTNTSMHHQPAPDIDPIDTTAAGDAFCGAMAAAIAEGLELVDAVAWAVMVGSATAMVAGAQSSLPTAAEVADRLGL